jgi:hypothetical protein
MSVQRRQPPTVVQGCQPPTWKSIWFWDNKLRTTVAYKISWKDWTSEECVNCIREAFQWSLCKSFHAASLQLQIPCSTVHNVLHKRFCTRAHKIQMIHAWKPNDQVARTNFAVDKLERLNASANFLHQVCFSDKMMSHVNGVVNRYNFSIWGGRNPHVSWREAALKWTCGRLNARQVHGLFFFSEMTVTGHSYLDMLQLYALPQLPPQTIL